MSSWVMLLPTELDSITEYREPTTEVEDTDEVCGEASDFIKKLFTLRQMIGDDVLACMRKLELTTNPETIRKINAERFEAETRGKAIDSLLWIAVFDEFQLWGKGAIHLRQGFIVTRERRVDIYLGG